MSCLFIICVVLYIVDFGAMLARKSVYMVRYGIYTPRKRNEIDPFECQCMMLRVTC